MKNLVISIFLVLIQFLHLEIQAENDSLKKTYFIIGLSGSPNNTYNIYAFGESNGGNAKFEDQKISFGGETELYIGFKTKKQQVTLGIGYSYNRNKNIREYLNKNGPPAITNSDFYCESYKIALNVNWLVGENKRWIVGTNVELSILNSYKEFVHIENNPASNQTDFSYEYYAPQNIGWIGVNFGRLFKINNLIDFNIVFNTKASSLILGKDPNYEYNNLPDDPARTNDRNFFVKTLNFNLCFKL